MTPVRLADTHCHLDDAQFDGDRDEIVHRAQLAGIDVLLAIGTGDGPPALDAAIRMAEVYPQVYATVGVHPNDAGKVVSDTFGNLHTLTRHPKVKAMGEIGLDYHWGVPKEIQLPVFIQQLELASAVRLPVVIHTRDAWADTLDTLETHWRPSGLPGVLHCFTGDRVIARRALDSGLYLAFGGVITYKSADAVRDAARYVPADRRLLETDAPYLAPAPHRGKRNEPAFVRYTAEAMAQLCDVSLETLSEQTTANFHRFACLADQPCPASPNPAAYSQR